MAKRKAPDLKDGAFTIVRNKVDTDAILLVRQSYNGSKWSLPGGGIRLGEIATHGAKREALEEASVEVLDLKLVGVFTLLKKYGMVLLFEADDWEGVPKPDGKETIEVKFAKPHEMDLIPDDIWTAQRALMNIANRFREHGKPIYGHLTMPPVIIRG